MPERTEPQGDHRRSGRALPGAFACKDSTRLHHKTVAHPSMIDWMKCCTSDAEVCRISSHAIGSDPRRRAAHGWDGLCRRAHRRRSSLGRRIPAARPRSAGRALPWDLPHSRCSPNSAPGPRRGLPQSPFGTICLNSAASYWDLTDEMPDSVHLAVAAGAHRPRSPTPRRRCISSRQTLSRWTHRAAARIGRDDRHQLARADGRRSHATSLARRARPGVDGAPEIPARPRCQAGRAAGAGTASTDRHRDGRDDGITAGVSAARPTRHTWHYRSLRAPRAATPSNSSSSTSMSASWHDWPSRGSPSRSSSRAGCCWRRWMFGARRGTPTCLHEDCERRGNLRAVVGEIAATPWRRRGFDAT